MKRELHCVNDANSIKTLAIMERDRKACRNSYYASRRSRRRDTVKLTVCVCVFSSCNCSTVALRLELRGFQPRFLGFRFVDLQNKCFVLELCLLLLTLKVFAVSSESYVSYVSSSARTNFLFNSLLLKRYLSGTYGVSIASLPDRLAAAINCEL